MRNKIIVSLIFPLYIFIGFVFLFFPIVQNKIANDTYVAESLYDLYQTEKIYQSNDIVQFIYPLVNPASSLKHLLYLIVGETQALNIYAILLFAVAGVGTYLTANRFIKNKFYSFIVGYAFAVLSLYFLQVELVAIIPFFVFFLIRFYSSVSKLNFILLLVTLLFIINLTLEDIAFITLFTAIFIGFFVFKNWRKWDKKFVFSLLIIFILLTFTIALKYNFSRSSITVVDILRLNSSSVDFASSLTPFQHLFFNNNQARIPFLNNADFNSPNIYLGILPLIFIIYALWIKRDAELITFLKISSICFLIFSLGPYLKIGNLINSFIPLPYLFLYRFVPVFDRFDDIKKLYILAYFPLTILLGMGLSIFFNGYKNRKTAKVFLAVTVIILTIQLLYFPRAEFFFKPDFMKNFASSQEKFSSIYLYSTSNTKNNLVTSYISGANLPNKKIFSIPIDNHDNRDLINSRLLYYNSTKKEQEEKSFIATKIKDEIFSRWDRDNIKYIILNKNELELQLLDNLKEIFKELRLRKYTEENGLMVYQVKAAPRNLDIIPGNGWIFDLPVAADLDSWQPKSAWSSWESSLEIINSSKKEKNIFLEFFIKSDDHRFLKVSRDGKIIKEFFIGPENQGFRIYLDHLQIGKTTLLFSTPKRYLADQMGATEPKIKFFSAYYEEIKDIKLPTVYQRIFNQPGEFKIWQIPMQNAYSFTNTAPKNIFTYDNLLDLVELTNDPVALRNNDIQRVDLCSLNLFFLTWIDWEATEINFDIFNRKSTNVCGEALFNHYNIKYLILEKRFTHPDGLTNYNGYIENVFPSAIIDWEDDDYLVYQILDPPTFPSVLINLQEGFGPLILPQVVKERYRQVNNNAELELINTSSNTINKNVKFLLRSSLGMIKVKLRFNNEELNCYTINSELQTVNLPSLNLKPGINHLNFQIEKNDLDSELFILQIEF